MPKRKRQVEPPSAEELARAEELAHRMGILRASDFHKRLIEGLKIPAFGPARHFIRRADQSEQTEFFPDRCWSIIAQPSFSCWGMFAVFESRSLIRCAFVCRGNLPEERDLDWSVVDCCFEVREWSDPVLDILTKGPLVPTPDRSHEEGTMTMTLDGIGYELQVASADVNATIRFSNPRGSYYRSLERAACDLAMRVAQRIEHPQVSRFVKTWMSYVR